MKKTVYLVSCLALIVTSCLTPNDNSNEANLQIETIPLREIKPLEYFANIISSDSVWYHLEVQKAKEWGKTADEVVNIDAKMLQEEDAVIIKIENDFIKNQIVLDSFKIKAKETGLSIDEYINIEAKKIAQAGK